MERPLTPDEARGVTLSWRPLRRLGQLAECGAGFGITVPESPLPHFPLFLTRRGLVKTAETYELVRAAINRPDEAAPAEQPPMVEP